MAEEGWGEGGEEGKEGGGGEREGRKEGWGEGGEEGKEGGGGRMCRLTYRKRNETIRDVLLCHPDQPIQAITGPHINELIAKTKAEEVCTCFFTTAMNFDLCLYVYDLLCFCL